VGNNLDGMAEQTASATRSTLRDGIPLRLSARSAACVKESKMAQITPKGWASHLIRSAVARGADMLKKPWRMPLESEGACPTLDTSNSTSL
jgi:hypothetical protein